jgi:iron complex transport system ATP-binding protein
VSIVELHDVGFVRGGTTILRDVSWSIARGQHWALVGPNGSGKTTLLKIVTGYEWPTVGTVAVLGERYGECLLPELRKAIGWVSAAIEQRLPLRDKAVEIVVSGFAASIGLYREPTSGQWPRAHEALGRLRAEAISDRPFGLLSQGEQQRVLIARALVHQPELLILDEPCAGLDPVSREALLTDLAHLAESPDTPTLILVTHHIEEIGPWVHRVMALRDGQVVASGPADDVLTAEFLGETFGCSCVVERHGDRRYLRVR